MANLTITQLPYVYTVQYSGVDYVVAYPKHDIGLG